ARSEENMLKMERKFISVPGTCLRVSSGVLCRKLDSVTTQLLKDEKREDQDGCGQISPRPPGKLRKGRAIGPFLVLASRQASGQISFTQAVSVLALEMAQSTPRESRKSQSDFPCPWPAGA